MGVKFLQTFISTLVPGGIFTINILDEIQKWKNNHSNCLIVIDAAGFVNTLTQINYLSSICGGNYRFARDQLNTFFKKLCDHGAELVFFFDGPCQAQKMSTKKDRIKERLKINQQISVDILANLEPSTIIQKYKKKIRKDEYRRILIDVCKLYGKLQTSTNHECDLEIAKYATENNALAILAQDTDFLIFEGNWHYWSIRESKLFLKCQTIEFNRSALRKELGLSQKQMPLLATLAGNDIINVDLIQPVFIGDKNKASKFNSIATFILENFTQLPKNLQENDVKLIAQTIFGNSTIESRNLIKESIKSYDTEDVTVKYFEESIIQKMYYGYSFIDYFLNSHSYSPPSGFYDCSENSFTAIKDIFLPFFKRITGIILKYTNELPLEKVIMYCNKDYNFISEKFQPEPPNIILPELDVLINPNDYSHFPEAKRFKLLSWLITGDAEQLMGLNLIDKKYMIVNATLYYLVKKNQIKVTEADCILSMVYAINEDKIHQEQISVVKLNPRAMTVINTYQKLFFFVENFFNLVGLNKFLVAIEVNGIYFQYLTNIFTNRPEVIEKYINRMGPIRHFYHLCG